MTDITDVPGLPKLRRLPEYRFTDKDISAILSGGTVDGRRNWLTGARAKDQITDEQLKKFWPGGR